MSKLQAAVFLAVILWFAPDPIMTFLNLNPLEMVGFTAVLAWVFAGFEDMWKR